MRFHAIYHIRCTRAEAEARAEAVAVEQSVEMPVAAITDERVLTDFVGRVDRLEQLDENLFAAHIALPAEAVGRDAGQLMNVLFGNVSLLEDVTLADVRLPPEMVKIFWSERKGMQGLRRKLGARRRAMTASALKPQGMMPAPMGQLAERMALGRLDFIKDDHGLADQPHSPFAGRVRMCLQGIDRAAQKTGHPTQYIPSLTGTLEEMRLQLNVVRMEGISCAMVAPMVSGFSAVHKLTAENPDLTFFGHPSMGGLRILPQCLIGALFPLIGMGAVIFPGYGGRFGYSRETCRQLAEYARDIGALPVPAGGMTLARTTEMLDFYGRDTILLIGGNLLLARGNITAEAEAFSRAVADYSYPVPYAPPYPDC